MLKSRWPPWAPVPNKPTVSRDVKLHSHQRPLLNSGGMDGEVGRGGGGGGAARGQNVNLLSTGPVCL